MSPYAPNAEVILALDEATQQEWLDARRLGISGSVAAAVLGLDPFKSPTALHYELTGEVPATFTGNVNTRMGHWMEDGIASEFERATPGVRVYDPRNLYRSLSDPHMLATPDRIIIPDDLSRGYGVLEMKNVGAKSSWMWANGAVPEKFIVQWQHYAYVLGLTWGYVAAWVAGSELVIRYMEADPEFQQILRDRTLEFWTNVQNKVPPAADGMASTTDALMARWPDHVDGKSVDAEPEIAAIAQRLRDQKIALTAGDKEKARLGNQIRKYMADAEVLLWEGEPLMTYKTQVTNRFDVEQFCLDHPELAEKYRKKSTTRVLRDVKKKGEPADD